MKCESTVLILLVSPIKIYPGCNKCIIENGGNYEVVLAKSLMIFDLDSREDLFAHFHDFWSQIGILILVTPKQEVERKSE